jgi:hypothetical protein
MGQSNTPNPQNDAMPKSDDTGSVHAASVSHFEPLLWKLWRAIKYTSTQMFTVNDPNATMNQSLRDERL